ncbi:MAG: nucleotidyltransferase domain-containing protein [bacterium]
MNDYIERLKQQVLEILKDEDVEVILFGSRAKGNGRNITSDIDVGIIPKSKFDRTKIAILREIVEEMNIPYKVDIVDFSLVSKKFETEALKEVERWKG